MTISDNNKKAILVIGSIIVIYWLIKPKKKALGIVGQEKDAPAPTERKKLQEPILSPMDAKANPQSKNAVIALKAYVKAYNAGESQSNLDDLNAELGKEYGMRVYIRRSDSKVVVSDLNGKSIIIM